MDVENARIVDGLIFGYLSRQQYYNTLRVFCNEAPSLRDSKNRLHSGGDVFIQVNDQLHDKSLEQIIHAFSAVGRFDVSPELIDFGVRLRHLTNEFSTMTAMRGRSLSDNQIKLYGKKAYSKMHPSRPSLSNSSLCANNSETSACRSTMYCVPPNSSEAEYVRQLHDNAVNASVEHAAQPQSASQQDLGYDYQVQQHVTASYPLSTSSPYITQTGVQCSNTNIVQAQSTQNIPCFQSTHLLPSAQQSNVAEEHMLVDVGVNVKNTENLEVCCDAPARPSGEERFDGSRAQMSSSFCSETGAHKRKAGVPHRRGDLVAHTAQSLIVPNGVLLDLESEAAASTTSQVSLLSNIDDSAMQCLDRLINGNLDEVFPFCDDHDGLSEFAASLDNPYAPSQSNDNDIEQESNVMCGEAVLTPLDVPAANSPLPREPASKNRSFDEGEIISDESNHAKTPKTSCGENIQTRVEERAPSPTLTSNDSRRSSLDSGRNRREEKRIADRLKEFNRNPPKPETRKSNAERVDRDTAVQESKGVPRSSPTPSSGRTSRDRVRRFSALFDEGHSATPSRDSSPHHERLSKKEEERRRREKEMEKERQRDKERLRKQRRDRETQRDRERSHRPSPERKTSEKRSIRGDDDGKNRESKDRERKRDPGEERKAVDEVERKKSDEKFRRDMLKKKKEEELETKRQAEQQRRAEAMRRKEEENKRRREERERQEEKRREEERQQKLREERIRREEEKALKRQEEEETRKAEEREDDRSQSKDEEEEEEVAKDDGEQSAEYRESEDDAASDDQHTARNYPDEEEGVNRKTSSTQDQWVHPRKIEQKRNNDNSAGRKVDGEVQQENDQDSVTTSENEEKRKKSTREEHQSLKNPIDIRKSLPLPCVPPRRDTVKKAPAKPLEPGMMMTDPGVLDRINKEMESLTPRNRTSHTRSAEESATSSKSTTSSTRIPKRDVPVDYAQVLFSNAPVIKRTPPAVEKKRNLVISSGLTTEYSNQLVFSKAHSSRLGMFLEKASEKHRRLMIERDYDSDAMSPFYEDPDRNDARSPFEVPHCPRQQSQKFVPQKRPLPAASLDSYLGSPVQSSPDIDGESSSQRSTSKKPKIDLSRMPDIIEKLYRAQMRAVLIRRLLLSQKQLSRTFCTPSVSVSVDERYDALISETFPHDQTLPEHWGIRNPKQMIEHDFMVVHPKVRWGHSSPSRLKDPQRQLDEAVTLVNTLPGFRVVESIVMGVDYNTKRKAVWGKGQIETLVMKKTQSRVTALMVNVDMLAPNQQHELFNIFHIPVYDRYNIVLSIFKYYARTQEARLQIQLAEIPYIRHRLQYLNKYRCESSTLNVERQPVRANVDEFEVLRLREQSLRKKLTEVVEKSVGKVAEENKDAAMVAIVGYTNAGKTSLVKCLTGASSLMPKDRLFATLDTTRHEARLPSGRKVVFTDTIGFLSDLPMHLLAAFQATLSHVKLADVIVHIRDLSNPDWQAQSEVVDTVLENIGLTRDRIKDIVIADNKVDIDKAATSSTPGAIRISCKTSNGVNDLIAKLDEMVLRATGCKLRRLRLKFSSPAIPYLYREGFVTKEPHCTDSHLVFDVFMNDAEFSRFQKSTGLLKKKNRLSSQSIPAVPNLYIMPVLSLDLKCNMVGVTNFAPSDPETHRWFLKFRCMNCGEAPDHWQYVVINEVLEVPGSRGEANLVEKCKLCNRVNTAAIVSDSVGSYDSVEHNEEWQSMLQIDCRGLEPFEFDPRNGWKAVGCESGTVFDDIDLSEKAWADYDEKVGAATEISDIEVRFVHSKTKK
ncbi:hypothetical protein RB195_015845 [Necator americanus]|uniref:Hflx-type G domain-containing protein n=1 Tax=Necator americanus TaxID=51031 RepID=A0ABR1E6V9_NECAM